MTDHAADLTSFERGTLAMAYEALLSKIEELADGMKKAGEEMGMWADQSAETWHDNFGYEEEERRQWSLSERLDSFVETKNNAEIVDAHATGEIDVGSRLVLEDRETGGQRTLAVGSYQVLEAQNSSGSPFSTRTGNAAPAPRSTSRRTSG